MQAIRFFIVICCGFQVFGHGELIINYPGKQPQQSSSSPIGKKILEMIDHAKISLDIAIYGFRKQPEILQALKRAKDRNVRIRFVIDRDFEGKNIYSDTPILNQVTDNIVSDYKFDFLEKLKESKFNYRPYWPKDESRLGPPQCVAYSISDHEIIQAVQASSTSFESRGAIMHHKFLISDDKKLLMGSTNWSNTGTGGYNANIAYYSEDPKFVLAFKNEFTQMFELERFHSRKKYIKTVMSESHSVYFSPQDRTSKKIIKLIDQASYNINIAMYFLTDKEIVYHLIEAHRRGVLIRVILDATGTANAYCKHPFLRRAGIALKIENWGGKMHMKAASIDKEVLVLGSMNWTRSGRYKNDEATVILSDSSLVNQFDIAFESFWRSIPEKYLFKWPNPESAYSLGSLSDQLDNDHDGLIDQVNPKLANTDHPPELVDIKTWSKRKDFPFIIGLEFNKKKFFVAPTHPEYKQLKKVRNYLKFASPYEAKLNGYRALQHKKHILNGQNH